MEYRLNKQTLLDELGQWNRFIKRKVHLIACGGTALTLLDIKPSTKDVDFMVPVEAEYKYLIKILKDLGYEQKTGSAWQKKGDVFIYDFFQGKHIHTTELLESPLEKERHILLKEFSHIYIGILNEYDLIASKLFRGTGIDFEDCLMLLKAHKDNIDITHLEQHVKELAGYDTSEDRIVGNLEIFLNLLRKDKLYG
jgi:hypothetical protein